MLNEISLGRLPKCYQRKMIFMTAGLQFLDSSSPKNHATQAQFLTYRILTMPLLFILSNWLCKSLTIIHPLKFIPNCMLCCKEKKDHLPKRWGDLLFSQWLWEAIWKSLTQMAITLPWQIACIIGTVRTKPAQIAGENYPTLLSFSQIKYLTLKTL